MWCSRLRRPLTRRHGIQCWRVSPTVWRAVDQVDPDGVSTSGLPGNSKARASASATAPNTLNERTDVHPVSETSDRHPARSKPALADQRLPHHRRLFCTRRPPHTLSGGGIGSHYQSSRSALSKHFRFPRPVGYGSTVGGEAHGAIARSKEAARAPARRHQRPVDTVSSRGGPLHPRGNRWTSTQTIAAVISAIAAVVGVLVAVAIAQGHIGVSDSDMQRAIEDALRNPGNRPIIDAPSTTAGAIPTTSGPEVGASSKVKLAVINYCFCGGPRAQAEVKIKPSVTNDSSSTIPLAADNLRLLVPSPLPGPWTPPSAAGDVVEVRVGDQTVLAIPPNPDRAAENLSGGQTFATHWDQTGLSPGASYLDEDNRQGDLVYYVPESSDNTVTVLGLAHVIEENNGDWKVMGFVETRDWSGEENPGDF